MDTISQDDIFENNRAMITDSTKMTGNKWFDAVKDYSKQKQ